MTWFLLAFYGYLFLCALGNWALMRRPSSGVDPSGVDSSRVVVLIPARDEAENLTALLPQIVPQVSRVYVFDDESTDGTGEIARGLGAKVLSPREILPAGWTGKNRACHELGLAAAEDSDADWWIYLDADVRVTPDFAAQVVAMATKMPRKWAVLTGFPTIVPGVFPEPLFLGWVGWILLATNPFWIVARTRMGHNFFTNGQITCWRPSVYMDLLPNEAMKGRVLEDVAIGRLLAKKGYGIETANLSSLMQVKMYDTWRQALDGMSKNSFEIAGSYAGGVGLVLLLVFVALAWILGGWPCYLLFASSMLFAGLTVRAHPLRILPSALVLTPVIVLIGAATVIRSAIWKRTGRTSWKGRIYS